MTMGDRLRIPALLLVTILLVGCSSPGGTSPGARPSIAATLGPTVCGPRGAGPGHDASHCDRSCAANGDCKYTCGCGAINRDEGCDDAGIMYDCVDTEVRCEDGQCVTGDENIPAPAVTEAQAIAAASATEGVQTFLGLYPDAKVAVADIGGCEWAAELKGIYVKCSQEIDAKRRIVVAYWTGDTWKGRHSTAVKVGLDPGSGEVIATYPGQGYIKDVVHCESDGDCAIHVHGCSCTNMIWKDHVPEGIEAEACDQAGMTCVCRDGTCTPA